MLARNSRSGRSGLAQRSTFVALLAALLVALIGRDGFAAVQALTPGQAFSGSIDAPGKVRGFSFELPAGTRVTIAAKGQQGFAPSLVLRSAATQELLTSASGGSSVAIKAFKLPESGGYLVEIAAADGASLGNFDGTFAAKAKKSDANGDFTGSGSDGPVAFAGAPGALVSGTLKRPKSAGVGPDWFQIAGPTGLVATDGFTKVEKGGAIVRLKNVPLEALGIHIVSAVPAVTTFSAHLKVKFPKKAPGGDVELTGEFDAVLLPVPTIDAHPAVVAVASHEFHGTAKGATMIEAVSPAGTALAPVAGDAFSIVVPLLADAVNVVHFHSLDGANHSSPVQQTTIVMDTEPPELVVHAPIDGAELPGLTSTVVVGTIRDRLSPADPITVTVNGAPAEVQLAPGMSGTFLFQTPLLGEGRFDLPVEAKDAHGNATQQVVSFSRIALQPDAPFMELLGGDLQKAKVGSVLKKPLVVRVRDAGGAPLASKPVSFEIVQGDGALSGSLNFLAPSQAVQAITDFDGTARVFWRVGSAAGLGNNALRISSVGIQNDVTALASATIGAPAILAISMGNHQRATAGSPLPAPIMVRLLDGQNPCPAEKVTFKSHDGGCLVDGKSQITVLTDALGAASVNVVLGPAAGFQSLTATFPGNDGKSPTFLFEAVAPNASAPTQFEGKVIDNALRGIGGARCQVFVNGQSTPPVFTGADGTFLVTGLASGIGELFVDGGVATSLAGNPIPVGSFPSLHFTNIAIVQGAVNRWRDDVQLPPLNPANAKVYNGTQDVALQCIGFDGLEFTIPAGSMTRADGTKPSTFDPAVVSLNAVHVDRIPMPLPDSRFAPFAWTFQPGGASFDPPVRVVMPNMTGLPPGTQVFLQSFDHATSMFEIVGNATVSEDGAFIRSLPASGLTISGWGGAPPPPPPPPGDVESCFGDGPIPPAVTALQKQKEQALAEANALADEALTLSQGIFSKTTGQLKILQLNATADALEASWAITVFQVKQAAKYVALAVFICVPALLEPTPFGEVFCGPAAATAGEQVVLALGAVGTSAFLAKKLYDQFDGYAHLALALIRLDQALAKLTEAAAAQAQIAAICGGLAADAAFQASVQALQAKLLDAKSGIQGVIRTVNALKESFGALIGLIATAKETLESWKQQIDDFLNGTPQSLAAGGTPCTYTFPDGETFTVTMPDGVDCEQALLDGLVLDPRFVNGLDSEIADGNAALAEQRTMRAEFGAAAEQLGNLEVGEDLDGIESVLRFEGFKASVGGASAPVTDIGGFRIPNVPSGSPLLSAIVTGTSGDETFFAKTTFTTVSPAKTSSVKIDFPLANQPPPVPVSLDLDPDTTLLLQTGGTDKITVNALFSDGQTLDVGTAAQGTSFTSSNAAVVTVDTNGVVTGKSIGIAFVTALNQGAAASRMVQVTQQTISTTIAGIVVDELGAAVSGADVGIVQPSGFGGTTAANGSFAFPLDYGVETKAVVVHASATIGGELLSASAVVSPLIAGGISDAGILTLSKPKKVLVVSGMTGSSRTNTTQDAVNMLSSRLTAAQTEFDVVDQVPSAIGTEFRAVYDLRFSNVFSFPPAEQQAYATFLGGGGKLYLTGENNNFGTHNAAISQMLANFGATGVSITTVNSTGVQPCIDPILCSTPNLVANVFYSAPGSINSLGQGTAVTVPAMGLWLPGTLANVPAGTILVSMDINMFQNSANIPFFDNLVRFL